MALLREQTGSYTMVFYSSMVTFSLAALLLALAKKPVKRDVEGINNNERGNYGI